MQCLTHHSLTQALPLMRLVCRRRSDDGAADVRGGLAGERRPARVHPVDDVHGARVARERAASPISPTAAEPSAKRKKPKDATKSPRKAADAANTVDKVRRRSISGGSAACRLGADARLLLGETSMRG